VSQFKNNCLDDRATRPISRAMLKAGVPVSIVNRHLAEHEVRVALIEEICVDKGALILDPVTGDVYFSADDDACKTAT
jgi:hypothetical protein